jgi:hypothetical protein
MVREKCEEGSGRGGKKDEGEGRARERYEEG